MATVTVSATRVDDAESNAGWLSIGGGQGPSAEGSFPYQGGNLVNKKITGTGGIAYDPTGDGKSPVDMTVDTTWMVKGIVTDYGGLNAVSGVRALIGSGSSAYHQFVIAGSAAKKPSLAAYTPRGGLFIVPVNPNIAGYRETTIGSPLLTAVDYLGFEANFDSSTAKAENVGCDAIDIGTGLQLSGAGGVYSDFLTFDESISGNRYGFAQSIYNGAVLIAFGEWRIGSATATDFTDTAATIIWPDGLFAAGWSRLYFDLQNTSTVITDGSSHQSLGTTDIEDTRADCIFSGTAGAATISHSLENFRSYVMTSAVTLDGANIDIVDLTQAGGVIQNSRIGCNSLAGVAVCDDQDFSKLTNNDWVQGAAGHAIEITVPGSYTLTTQRFVGFGSDGATDAAIHNNSGGAVTLNITGGSAPTIRNGAGSTTVVVEEQIQWDFVGIPDGLEFRIRQGTKTLLYVASVSGGSVSYLFPPTESGRTVTVTCGGVASDSTPYERVEDEYELPSVNNSSKLNFSVNESYAA